VNDDLLRSLARLAIGLGLLSLSICSWIQMSRIETIEKRLDAIEKKGEGRR